MRWRPATAPALLAESDALAARGLVRRRQRSKSSRRCSIASRSRRPCPAAVENFDDAARIAAYAQRFSPESVQLAYQICAQGRADLAIAPDEATGFAMTLLRLLAFEPARPTAPATPSRSRRPRLRPPVDASRHAATPNLSARSRAARARRAGVGAPGAATKPGRAPCCPTIRPRGPDSWRGSSSAAWPRSWRRRASCARAGQRRSTSRSRRRTSTSPTGLFGQAQGRARAGDRPQADARLRGRATSTPASLAAQERRERDAGQRAQRSRVPRRTVRARHRRAFRRERSPGIDQAAVERQRSEAPAPVQERDRHDEEPARRPDEAGPADAGQHEAAQEELAQTEVEGQSGAGLVKVVMTCRHDVKRVAIDPRCSARTRTCSRT